MNKAFRLKTFGGALALAGFLISGAPGISGLVKSAVAQASCPVRPKQTIAPQMTPENFKIFSAAQEAMDAQDFAGAFQIINDFLSRKGLSAYEEAMGYMIRGLVFYNQNKTPQAIQEFLKILSMSDIPYSTDDQILYAVAQFYFIDNDFQNSLKYLNRWFCYQPEPNSQSLVLRSQIYYNFGEDLQKAGKNNEANAQFRNGIKDIEQAMEIAKADPNVEILENWYQTEFALYFALKDYRKAADVTEILIVKWPRPQYWSQLSALYGELEEFDKQLAVLDVAYRLGYLTKEANLVAVAQLYNVNGAPYLGAKVMQKNLQPHQVDGKTEFNIDPNDKQHQMIYGQALLAAKEYKESTKPLEKAAALSEDGQIYLQLGSVYSMLEDWKDAAKALENALKKDDLGRPDQTYLYLGMAYVNMEEFAKAEKAFKTACTEARKIDVSCRASNGWLNYIKAEKQRLKRLADAGLRK